MGRLRRCPTLRLVFNHRLPMRNLFVFSIAVLALPAVLLGVYAPIPEFDQATLFVVEIEGGVGWDDNILGDNEDEIDSSYVTFRPRIRFDATLQDRGFIRGGYRLSGFYYEERPGDTALYNHQIDLEYSYRLSDRTDLSLSNRFQIANNPEVRLSIADPLVQADQSNTNNSFGGDVRTRLSEKFSLSASGRYYFIDYDEDALAERLDRDQVRAGLRGSYRFLPELSFSLGADAQSVEYETNDDERGSDSVIATVGADYTVSDRADLSGRIGVEARDRNTGESTDSLNLDVRYVFRYQPTSYLSVGIGHEIEEATNTDRFFDEEATRVSVNLQHDLTGNGILLGSIGVHYKTATLRGRETAGADDSDEETLRLGLGVTYNISNNLRVIGQYDLDEVTSDVVARERTRNRFSISVSYKFGS